MLKRFDSRMIFACARCGVGNRNLISVVVSHLDSHVVTRIDFCLGLAEAIKQQQLDRVDLIGDRDLDFLFRAVVASARGDGSEHRDQAVLRDLLAAQLGQRVPGTAQTVPARRVAEP